MRTMRHEERSAKAAQMAQERTHAKPPQSTADLSGTGWLPEEGFKGPISTTHTVLMHTGKVLFIAGSVTDLRIFEQVPPVEDPARVNSCPADANDVAAFPPPWALADSAAVWDPVKNTFSRPAVPFDNSGKPLDLFCVGHSVLPDGRVLAAGGTSGYAPDRGLSTTVIFDPITESFTKIASMNSGRWYPTFVTLGSGRVFCASGINNQGNDVDFNPEIFSHVGWTSFTYPTRKFPTYPQMFLLENGSIFYSGGSFNENAPVKPCILTLPDSFSQPIQETDVPGLYGIYPHDLDPDNPDDQRNHATSVLLPPAQDQRVMICGGGNRFLYGGNTTATVFIVDLKDRFPVYKQVDSLSVSRMHVNAVILPNRTVFVCNGTVVGEDVNTGQLQAEIFDPSTNMWTVAERQTVAHGYHSMAMLLPDGSIATGGGTPTGACNELRMQIYRPAYMSASRPQIQETPKEIHYGKSFNIRTDQAHNIKWVNLIRPTAVTHSHDMEQRLVDLPIASKGKSSLMVSVPSNPNLAPPGWYMLTITDMNNIPSVASWVHLSGKTVHGDHHED